ncbi:ABC transporter permease [Maritimibacter sp. 55A14]|nr:ABC transporter permease [Maritimibacter sp. 55A14]
MDALDRKLLRDFRRLWAQALVIALVLACGVAILLTTFGMYGALEETRATYYERNRFADIFADARRAPASLLPVIRGIDGVRSAEARVVEAAILDIPGRTATATGRIVSLPRGGAPELNLPVLVAGRLPDPEAADEIAVNAPFAAANGFRPGDRLSANLNGRKRALTITGTLLSPEFIYTIGPGALVPDSAGFGILWMPERAVAAAFDMEGAFNNVTLKLDPSATQADVIDRLDVLLEPYGGFGAQGRDLQQSHAFVDAEMQQLRSTAMVLPPIFFAITAFLVNMVIGRIIALERSEIGLLKAIGYFDAEICIHYLLLAVLIAAVGTGLGWAVGTWLSRALAGLYAEFFDFPFLIYRASFAAYAISGLLAVASAALGALHSALKAARMPPAVAMTPPAPPRYRSSLFDRALAAMRVSQPVLMIFRGLLRWPLRSALSALGMALAVAVLVAAGFFTDALDTIVDKAFYQSNRQDAVLSFTEEVPEAALEAVANLPGVLRVEGQLFHVAVLRNGPHEKRVPLEGRYPGADLSRVVDEAGRRVDAPPGGILLARRLARQLDVRPGEMIEVAFLSGRRETQRLRVSGTIRQYFGLGAYMDAGFLNALNRQAPRISAANVTLDSAALPDFHGALKDIPALSGITMMDDVRGSFQETIRKNVTIMTTIYITIAVLITVGVAYNGARIQLSERARELASLRILGFTRGEVSFVLMGESMLLALIAQPFGWMIGAGIAALMTSGFTSDLYAIPLVLEPAAFARASLIVLVAALVSSLIVRRRLDRLDLVAVMKSRE